MGSRCSRFNSLCGFNPARAIISRMSPLVMFFLFSFMGPNFLSFFRMLAAECRDAVMIWLAAGFGAE